MIGYLEGVVLATLEKTVILNVGGVGYEAFAPSQFLQAMQEGEALTLYIHTHVREDQLSLYGFRSLQERKLFLLLLGVNGVGPKSALEILNVPLEQFQQALMEGDAAFVQKVPGIGKKTAEKIILELQDKLDVISGGAVAMTATGTAVPVGTMDKFTDVIEALQNLGYDKRLIVKVIEQKILGVEGMEEATEEDVLKLCLQHL